MAYSIYDVDSAQSIGKPSDLLQEDDYTTDVFFQTRPDNFDFDHRDRGEGVDESNPYFKFYPEDESVKYQEWGDQNYNYSPQNWDSQDAYTTDLRFKKRKYSVENVIGNYRMNHDYPITMDLIVKGHDHNIRNAATFEMLMRQVYKFPKVKERATKTTTRLIKADEKNLTWKYRVRGHEEYSSKKGHVVTVKIDRDKNEKDMRKMTVKLTCTCPFWKYKGPDYNANRYNYLEGPQMSNGDSPKVNPSQARKTLICKHVYAVGLLFQKFAAKHNLDTYKEVDEIFKLLNDEKQSLLPDIGMENIEEITKMLDRSDKKIMEPLIGKYHREEDENKKEKLHKEAVNALAEILEYKDKSFLQKVLKNIKDYSSRLFRKLC